LIGRSFEMEETFYALMIDLQDAVIHFGAIGLEIV